MRQFILFVHFFTVFTSFCQETLVFNPINHLHRPFLSKNNNDCCKIETDIFLSQQRPLIKKNRVKQVLIEHSQISKEFEQTFEINYDKEEKLIKYCGWGKQSEHFCHEFTYNNKKQLVKIATNNVKGLYVKSPYDSCFNYAGRYLKNITFEYDHKDRLKKQRYEFTSEIEEYNYTHSKDGNTIITYDSDGLEVKREVKVSDKKFIYFNGNNREEIIFYDTEDRIIGIKVINDLKTNGSKRKYYYNKNNTYRYSTWEGKNFGAFLYYDSNGKLKGGLVGDEDKSITEYYYNQKSLLKIVNENFLSSEYSCENSYSYYNNGLIKKIIRRIMTVNEKWKREIYKYTYDMW
ncbi:hypothetical protein NBT05_11455 [Aquimarina sp. ERC-38]|uniref:hypothetical protein n=1 Tax=Aquimarina sp. ERC-38 TaxID=2949996 RepID=UPI002247C2F4|nr:hypothetical protein [Aquimarina sp. ERC-38]UZO79572.1 hypothetical protein NBT05_11455 [Aquimarina sp. ERC-38]